MWSKRTAICLKFPDNLCCAINKYKIILRYNFELDFNKSTLVWSKFRNHTTNQNVLFYITNRKYFGI